MYSKNFTTNSTSKQAAYGLQYVEDFTANGSNVRLPAISKHGFVRAHSTGEFVEQRTRSGFDGKPKTLRGLAAREAKRQAARDRMEAEGWL